MSKTVDISEFQQYADKYGGSEINIGDFFQALEESLNKGKKEGKGLKSTLTTFGKPDLTISSWKFKEWDYVNPEIQLPSNARGLFTDDLQKKILVRGYDKFFNVDECKETNLTYMAENLKGPFEVTLKSNGCIILISGLEDGTLVVCSKHSTGHREDNFRNHALQGKTFLEHQLQQKGISSRELALTLYKLNITAVAEYCDDEFEEHVLKYSGDDRGLYLHGLNFNTPEFKTWPFEYVVRFGELFNFKTTEYFIENDYNKMIAFFNESSKTGMYNGVEVEGFVIRCKKKDTGEDYFWKYKFEEPYLMYREWREATKKLIRVKNLDDSALKKYKGVTKDYLEFIHPIISRRDIIAQYYKQGHGIIDLRNLYLEYVGKKGHEIRNGFNSSADVGHHSKLSQDQLEKSIDALVESLSKATLNPELPDEFGQILGEGGGASFEEATIVTKFILVPIATIGCGKTTVALTLNHLFPEWGVVQSDNLLQNKKFKNRLERKCLEFLSGNSDAIKDEHLNQDIDEFLKNQKKYKNSDPYQITTSKIPKDIILDKNNVVIADRNNHMYIERKEIINNFERLKKNYLPSHNEFINEAKTQKAVYKFKYIALNFLTEDNFENDRVRTNRKLWDITQGRVIKRGANHQSIKLQDEKDVERVSEIMKGFVERFQICHPFRVPDSLFDFVIDLDIFADESSRKNVDTILNFLSKNVPDIFQGKPLPTKEQVDDAFEKALSYAPSITKIVSNRNNSKKNGNGISEAQKQKLPRILYFGILVKDPASLLHKINTLIAEKLSGLGSSFNLYQQLIDTKRIQNRFHITLVHVAQKDKKQLFKNYVRLLESVLDSKSSAPDQAKLAADASAIPVGNILADVQLEKLVWDSKVVAVVARIQSVKNATDSPETLQYANAHLHITIGTASKEIKPVYSNELLAYATEYISSAGKDGVFENDIHVLSWEQDREEESVLKDLPLVAFSQ